MTTPIYTTATGGHDTRQAYRRRVTPSGVGRMGRARQLANAASRSIRERIRPSAGPQQADLDETQRRWDKDYDLRLIGALGKNVDWSKPETLEAIRAIKAGLGGAAPEAAGVTGPPVAVAGQPPRGAGYADPHAQKQARIARVLAARGRVGAAKMATLRGARLEETAPARQATQEYRERMLAGQRAKDVQFAKEREAAGGPVGVIRTPEGVAIPERLFEQAQREKRYPLAAPEALRPGGRMVSREYRDAEAKWKQVRQQITEATRQGKPAGQLMVQEEKLLRRMEAASAPTAAPRPSETPTIQALQYGIKARPLVEKKRRVDEAITRAEREWGTAGTAKAQNAVLARWTKLKRASNTLDSQIQAAPPAPSATALGVEQAEIQTGLARRAPEYRAMGQRMVGAARAAVTQKRATQEAVRELKARRPEFTGLPTKDKAVSINEQMDKKAWEFVEIGDDGKISGPPWARKRLKIDEAEAKAMSVEDRSAAKTYLDIAVGGDRIDPWTRQVVRSSIQDRTRAWRSLHTIAPKLAESATDLFDFGPPRYEANDVDGEETRALAGGMEDDAFAEFLEAIPGHRKVRGGILERLTHNPQYFDTLSDEALRRILRTHKDDPVLGPQIIRYFQEEAARQKERPEAEGEEE